MTYKQAQSRANDGIPSIGITKDHVVIVRPNNGSVPSDVKYVRIAQAGKTCYNDTTLAYAWLPTVLVCVSTLGMKPVSLTIDITQQFRRGRP